MNNLLKLILILFSLKSYACEFDIYFDLSAFPDAQVENVTITQENHQQIKGCNKRLINRLANMRRTLFLRNFREKIGTHLKQKEKVYSFEENQFNDYDKKLLKELHALNKCEQRAIIGTIKASYLQSYQNYLNKTSVNPISDDKKLLEFNKFLIRYDIIEYSGPRE